MAYHCSLLHRRMQQRTNTNTPTATNKERAMPPLAADWLVEAARIDRNSGIDGMNVRLIRHYATRMPAAVARGVAFSCELAKRVRSVVSACAERGGVPSTYDSAREVLRGFLGCAYNQVVFDADAAEGGELFDQVPVHLVAARALAERL